MAGLLMVGATPVQVDAQDESKKVEVFNLIKEMFRLDSKTIAYLLNTMGMETIDDFRRLGADKATFLAKASAFVPKIVDLAYPDREVSRLCKAWEGIHTAALSEESNKAKAAEAPDLDAPLPKMDMEALQLLFWRRHKLRWPPAQT